MPGAPVGERPTGASEAPVEVPVPLTVIVAVALTPASGCMTATAENGANVPPLLAATAVGPALLTVSASRVAVASTARLAVAGGDVPSPSDSASVVATTPPGAAWCAVGVKRTACIAESSEAGVPLSV